MLIFNELFSSVETHTSRSQMIGGTCKLEALFLAEEYICMDTLSVLFREKKKKNGLIDGKSKSFYHLKMQNDH